MEVIQDLSQLDGLMQAFANAPEIFQEEEEVAMRETVEEARDHLAAYPPQQHKTRREVYGTPFKSGRQRRFFFAALKSGEIVVPYRRTGELGKSWRTEINSSANAVNSTAQIIGRVFTQLPTAKYVQDANEQSRMLTNWQTAQSVAADMASIARENFANAAGRANKRMLE